MGTQAEGAPFGCPLSSGARGFAHPEPIGVTPLFRVLLTNHQTMSAEHCEISTKDCAGNMRMR